MSISNVLSDAEAADYGDYVSLSSDHTLRYFVSGYVFFCLKKDRRILSRYL